MSQSSSATTVCGSVSGTIWFSTERNSMSAIGRTKVMTTKSSSGATSSSARSFCARIARRRLTFSGVPSAASMGPLVASAGAFAVTSAIVLPLSVVGGRDRGPARPCQRTTG